MRKDEFPIVDKLVKDSINEVLDKISSEIESLAQTKLNAMYQIGLVDSLKIIDKYRKEQE